MKEKDKEISGVVTTNKEAFRDYFVLEALEAGLVLTGCEIKSLRNHKTSLAGSFARLEKNELMLYNMHIAPYEMGSLQNSDPLRERKLLLHRAQIERLKSKIQEKGLAVVPLKVYLNKRGIAKVEIALVKGKNLYDKRADIKKNSARRDIDRAIKNKNRKN